jgi:hypothetical protein
MENPFTEELLALHMHDDRDESPCILVGNWLIASEDNRNDVLCWASLLACGRSIAPVVEA